MSSTHRTSTKTVDSLRTGPGAMNGPAITATRPPEPKAPAMELKQPVATAPGRTPTVDDIRRRAYDLYLARRVAGTPGGPETDWLQAERELRTRV